MDYENIEFFLQYADNIHINYIDFSRINFFFTIASCMTAAALISVIMSYQVFNFYQKKDLFTKKKKNVNNSQNACVYFCYMNMWNRHIHTGTQNVHNVQIYNIGILKHKNTYGFFVQVRNFITFELKGFSTWGRERHNLFMTTFPSAPPPCVAPVAHKFVCSQWALKVTCLPRMLKFNQLTFLKSQLMLPVHDVTHIPGHILYPGFLLWHLCSMHAREHLRSCLHLTNPCTEPKGSQPK